MRRGGGEEGRQEGETEGGARPALLLPLPVTHQSCCGSLLCSDPLHLLSASLGASLEEPQPRSSVLANVAL